MPRQQAPIRRWMAAAAAVIATSTTVDAWADAGPKFGNGFWLPIGATLGGAFRGDLPNGFVLGGEVSGTYLWIEGDSGGMWLGGVADAVWDFGTDAFRHRVGPEIGWGPVGIDLTYVGQAKSSIYDPGINVRGVFTLAVVSLYGGYGHIFTDGDGGGYGEFGGLVKFPIPVAVEPHQRLMPPAPPEEDPAEQPSSVPLRPVPTDDPPREPAPSTAPNAPLQPIDEPPAAVDEPYASPPPDEAESPYATPPPPPPAPPPPDRGPAPDSTSPIDPSGG